MTEERTAQQIWQAALGELQLQVNKSNYRTWLEKTVGLACLDHQFVIGVPNTFVAEYLDKNQRSLIEKTLTGLLQHEVNLEFKIDGNYLVSHESRAKAISPHQASLPLFNPRYTFDSFIVGSCNQLAYAAARQVVEKPGYSYNPLFIYGGTGVGKTHLLQAIGQMAVADNLKVIYASAEQFTNELTSAIREKKTEDFRNKYRSAEMLLVDDIQFFSGKEQMAENFLHTFRELHNTSHQIAITSDRPPQSIPLLSDRLRSRFEWGLVTDIRPADFETRLAILQAKASQKGINVSLDILELIALQVQQDVRALEGALNRVIAYAKLMRAELNPELAAQALKNINGNEPQSAPVTPGLIVEAVANCFQLTLADLKGRKRDESIVLARQVAMYLIRQETNCSLAEVGKELGDRSPATTSHAYQKIASGLNNNPSLQRKVFEIQQKIRPVEERTST